MRKKANVTLIILQVCWAQKKSNPPRNRVPYIVDKDERGKKKVICPVSPKKL